MVLSEKNKNEANQEFKKLPEAIQTKIRNTTVRLSRDGKNFRASAAIIELRPATVILVTAKHNLWVRGDLKKPPDWNQYPTLAQAFKDNVDILYAPNDKGNPTRKTSIATVNLPEEHIETSNYCEYVPQSWNYDVIWLTVQDDTFTTWVKNNDAYFLSSNDKQGGKALRDFIYDPLDFTGKPSVACTRAETQLIQAGYGQTSEKNFNSQGSGLLQYRFTASNFNTPICKLQDEDWSPKDAFILEANDDSTTSPGDSGGPLFAYVQKRGALHLVGVTLGSNFEQAHGGKPLPEEPIITNASSSLYTYLVGEVGE